MHPRPHSRAPTPVGPQPLAPSPTSNYLQADGLLVEADGIDRVVLEAGILADLGRTNVIAQLEGRRGAGRRSGVR